MIEFIGIYRFSNNSGASSRGLLVAFFAHSRTKVAQWIKFNGFRQKADPIKNIVGFETLNPYLIHQTASPI